MNPQLKRNITLYSILTAILYFVVFGYLSYRPFDDWALSAFFDSIVAVFMGAGTIAIITGIILVVQSMIEGERDRKQKVFEQKLSLYNHIIDEMRDVYRVRETEERAVIDATERHELFFTQLRVALLSKPKTFNSYSRLIDQMAEEDGGIRDEASSLLLDFVVAARDDLDIQEKMDVEDEARFNEALAIAENEAEDIQRTGRGTYFVGTDPIDQYASQFGEAVGPALRGLLKSLHDILKAGFAFKEGVSFDVTRTGGLSCFAGGKKRNGKFCYTRFEESRLPDGSKTWGVALYLLKAPDNNFQVPKIDGLITHQSPHGFEFYVIILESSSQLSEAVKALIDKSYTTRVNGLPPSTQKSKQELRALARQDLGFTQ